jgi:hypothetical protein
MLNLGDRDFVGGKDSRQERVPNYGHAQRKEEGKTPCWLMGAVGVAKDQAASIGMQGQHLYGFQRQNVQVSGRPDFQTTERAQLRMERKLLCLPL